MPIDFSNFKTLLLYKDYFSVIIPIFKNFRDRPIAKREHDIAAYKKILTEFLQSKKSFNIKKFIRVVEHEIGDSDMLSYSLQQSDTLYRTMIEINPDTPHTVVHKNHLYIMITGNTVKVSSLINGSSREYGTRANPYLNNDSVLFNLHKDEIFTPGGKNKYFIRYSLFLGSGLITLYAVNEVRQLSTSKIQQLVKNYMKEKLAMQMKCLSSASSPLEKIMYDDINITIKREDDVSEKLFNINRHHKTTLARSYYFVVDARECFTVNTVNTYNAGFVFHINRLKFYQIIDKCQDKTQLTYAVYNWYLTVYNMLTS